MNMPNPEQDLSLSENDLWMFHDVSTRLAGHDSQHLPILLKANAAPRRSGTLVSSARLLTRCFPFSPLRRPPAAAPAAVDPHVDAAGPGGLVLGGASSATSAAGSTSAVREAQGSRIDRLGRPLPSLDRVPWIVPEVLAWATKNRAWAVL